MNELHLFAGAGGGILAGQMRGNRCVCAVELDPYAQAVLIARQNDGTFPPFPIWDDVRTFDGRRWRGIVDILAGGFPCQDISAAGTGDGLDSERSGLWFEMARVIREVRPQRVEVENSPMLTSRGLGRILGDLAAMGFDVEWGVLSAADTGAPHLRERIWILAHANGLGEQQPERCEQEIRRRSRDRGPEEAYPDADGFHAQSVIDQRFDAQGWPRPNLRPSGPLCVRYGSWPAESGLGRMAYGVADRPHRLKALGNGQVSRVAAAAFTLLDR